MILQNIIIKQLQVASLASLAQLLPPSFAYVSNPVPDSSLHVQSCCSLAPIASASAAAPRAIASIRFNCCSPFASASAAAPRLRPLLPNCVRFNCCSPIVSASTAAPRLCPLRLLLPDCVRFNCSSPIVSASTAAPQLCPLRLLLPDCVRFNCSSPIVSTSTAAPAVLEDSSPSQSLRFSKLLKYEGRASLV